MNHVVHCFVVVSSRDACDQYRVFFALLGDITNKDLSIANGHAVAEMRHTVAVVERVQAVHCS
jgi:hypothetical protein